jgi:hypothetical protein
MSLSMSNQKTCPLRKTCGEGLPHDFELRSHFPASFRIFVQKLYKVEIIFGLLFATLLTLGYSLLFKLSDKDFQ